MPRTRRPYSAEFRHRLVELVRGGQCREEFARKFEPSANAIRKGGGKDPSAGQAGLYLVEGRPSTRRGARRSAPLIPIFFGAQSVMTWSRPAR